MVGGYDAVVVQVEPGLPVRARAGRLERALSWLAFSFALRRAHDVVIRLEREADLPGGPGGRAALQAWRSADRIVVGGEDQRSGFLLAMGTAGDRSVVISPPVPTGRHRRGRRMGRGSRRLGRERARAGALAGGPRTAEPRGDRIGPRRRVGSPGDARDRDGRWGLVVERGRHLASWPGRSRSVGTCRSQTGDRCCARRRRSSERPGRSAYAVIATDPLRLRRGSRGALGRRPRRYGSWRSCEPPCRVPPVPRARRAAAGKLPPAPTVPRRPAP